MTVKRIATHIRPVESATLTRHLIEEWRRDTSASQQPYIIEEGRPEIAPFRVHVIWDEWKELDRIARSSIVMDAMEAVYGKQALLNTTLALGLTLQEADRLGIKF